VSAQEGVDALDVEESVAPAIARPLSRHFTDRFRTNFPGRNFRPKIQNDTIYYRYVTIQFQICKVHSSI
jgi:hypothetical protein